MKRFLLGLVLLLVPSLGWAACDPVSAKPGMIGCEPPVTSVLGTDWVPVWTPGTYPDSARRITVNDFLAGLSPNLSSGTVLSTGSNTPRTLAARFADPIWAKDYGVVADGVTSDDVAMAAAVAACGAQGGKRLMLPTGKILLTGAAPIQMKNCYVVGNGIQVGISYASGVVGTTFLITSLVQAPFIVGSNWGMEGVVFYWPGQINGTTVYPPLMTDNNVVGSGNWSLDNIMIVNAYDAIIQHDGISWASIIISNSYLYAAHDFLSIGYVTDGIQMENLHFTPGPWLQLCGFDTCHAGVNAAALVNKMYHISGTGHAAQLFISGGDCYAWRYGIYVDAGASLTNSIMYGVAYDGMATIIDSSSGGRVINTIISGGQNFACWTPNYGGSSNIEGAPCFNLGQNTGLSIYGFNAAASGSYIESSGSSLDIIGGVVSNIGHANDGNDYYGIHYTSNAGSGRQLSVQDLKLNGRAPDGVHDTKVHGINLGPTPLARVTIQNSQFGNFNDVITMTPGIRTMITGNWDNATTGSVSTAISGITGQVTYGLNDWIHPQNGSVSACGTGATVLGAISGTITVGSTNPTTSCKFTLPWIPYGATGNCQFTPRAAVYLYAIEDTPSDPTDIPSWTITASGDTKNAQIYFNCLARQ